MTNGNFYQWFYHQFSPPLSFNLKISIVKSIETQVWAAQCAQSLATESFLWLGKVT